MTTIPVLWVSRHYDEGVMCRGDKADQAMLEATLDGSLWRVPGGYTFEHHEIARSNQGGRQSDPPWTSGIRGAANGAVVVIPARDHEGDEGYIRTNLDRLDWALVMLTSEEEWGFDWTKLTRDNRKFWVWQARPEHADLAGHMPCGWYPGTREGLRGDFDRMMDAIEAVEDRSLDFYFAGQVTHQRRHDCYGALVRTVKKGKRHGRVVETDGYMVEGDKRADYLELMSMAKVIPCPSGPESLCTARVEEALEAGCIPLLDLVKPRDPQFDYWRMIWPDHPMPTIRDWADFPEKLDELLGDWPRLANRCWAWWQQWKRGQSWRLQDNITELRGAEPDLPLDPNDLITVIVPTSPTERHPSTDHIEETIASVRENLPGAEIIITADGVRPEQEGLRGDYETYLHRLCWLTNFAWSNVVPLVADSWQHQALTTRAALDLVRTPLVLFVEHDTPLTGHIDWPLVTDLVASGEANLVRFAEDTKVHPDHEFLFLDHETKIQRGVPVRRTWAWQARPHVASTRFWRERIMPHFPADSEVPSRDEGDYCRTFIEDPLYGYLLNQREAHGDAAWWDWRMFMYAPDEMTDPPLGHKRHRHINSRGSEPKYDIWGFQH